MVVRLDIKLWTEEGKQRLKKGIMVSTLRGKCLRPRIDLQKVLRIMTVSVLRWKHANLATTAWGLLRPR